jgi:hypothetical protein
MVDEEGCTAASGGLNASSQNCGPACFAHWQMALVSISSLMNAAYRGESN